MKEILARKIHDIWSNWMRYVFSKGKTKPFGELALPEKLVARWQRQIETDYVDLPDEEKRSDIKIAEDILAMIDWEVTVMKTMTNNQHRCGTCRHVKTSWGVYSCDIICTPGKGGLQVSDKYALVGPEFGCALWEKKKDV